MSFEEGTCAAWLHDLLKPHVTKCWFAIHVKNALLRDGNKNDREDAASCPNCCSWSKLHPVYHGENGIRMLKELSRSYLTITRDLTRVMNRLKAIYRGWGIACAGQQVYAPRYRAEWLAKITEAGVRRRAELYYQQFDALLFCASKCAESYWRSLGSTGNEIATADSLVSVRFARFCWWL